MTATEGWYNRLVVVALFCLIQLQHSSSAFTVVQNHPHQHRPTTTTRTTTTFARLSAVFQATATDENNKESYLTKAAAAAATTMPPSRRSFVTAAATAALSLFGGATMAVAASAAAEEGTAAATVVDPLIDVYFGVGCFWHIQHEFVVQGELKLLQRNEHQLTSKAGYAGGKATDREGRVCYHNLLQVADYGTLGHGEVVGMTIPESKLVDFTALYFSLFDPRTGNRVDPMDRGSEYRNVIGLPNGMDHPLLPKLQQIAATANTAQAFTLTKGNGNDPDTLGKRLVYVYDTNQFPFYQAEVYHQYHNDFQSPAYGKGYNALADLALEEGRIKTTGCPDRV